MKNINKLFAIFFLSFFMVFVSCEDEGFESYPNDITINTSDIAGDWFVEFLIDGVDVYGLGINKISTYNTASDTGSEMWIDDLQNTWWFKVKSSVNTEAMTFSGEELASNVDGYEVTVNILNGKIIKDGATSINGHVSDSIYFEAVFSDDPDNIYQLAGFRRTGFLEDEH